MLLVLSHGDTESKEAEKEGMGKLVKIEQMPKVKPWETTTWQGGENQDYGSPNEGRIVVF
jgi:hypothetical protein